MPLYTYKSSQLLRSEEDVVSMNGDAAEEEEEEWPPFRKVSYKLACISDNVQIS